MIDMRLHVAVILLPTYPCGLGAAACGQCAACAAEFSQLRSTEVLYQILAVQETSSFLIGKLRV
jgi:hypothetical protein